MAPFPQKLLRFLSEHQVLCLSTQEGGRPHSTPLFYAFHADMKSLIFISDPKTRHMKDIEASPQVSVGIYLETEAVGKIQGVQVWGTAALSASKEISSLYFKRFPHARIFAAANPSHRFCSIRIRKARLIDNTLGFGKKLEWSFDD